MIIIDTHVLIWWIDNPERLSKKAKELIKKEVDKGVILISSISVWEIYMLVVKDRLKLTMDTDAWLEKIENLPFIQFVPIDNKIAAKSVTLPGNLHADLANRMIIATAREKGVVLITSDERIKKYIHVQTVW